MDDKNQKERLEQELRFLKESFEAEVISKEEFEKGKNRIEKKLREIVRSGQKANEESKNEQSAEQKETREEPKKDDIIEKKEETKNDSLIESKTDGKIKLRVIQDEAQEQNYFEQAQSPEKKDTPNESVPEKHEKDGKFFKYAVVFIVLVLAVFFAYTLLKSNAQKAPEKTTQMKFAAACNSNDDCKQEGKEGICMKPGSKDAKCEFKDIPKTNVVVLNDRKECFNCDTQRVLSILEDWFGALNTKELDYNAAEGKNIAEKLNLRALPAYILDENITKKPKYEQFKRSFAKKGNDYLLSEDAASSTFFFKRDNVPNKLELFVIENEKSSITAENNLKEFLNSFKEVKFEKHLPDDNLAKELGIRNFPAFLVNNKVKFSGVLAAETIKENFCKINKLPECGKSLSKSLV